MAVERGVELAQLAPMEVTLVTAVKNQRHLTEGKFILSTAEKRFTDVIPADKLHTELRTGHPADVILDEIADGRYDLIIMGEREHHHLISRLLGPTVNRVVERACCPVLIAKSSVLPLQRLLLCDSGLREPSLLQRMKHHLAKLLNGRAVQITVLHVMSQISAGPGVMGQQLRADAEELIASHAPEGDLLAQDLRLLAATGLVAEPKIRHGLVVDEIIAETATGDYDLIVIGAHRSNGWQRFLLDDLANQIMMQSKDSVLIIP
jgi:nucleotide-binding universal stress UspA family protein